MISLGGSMCSMTNLSLDGAFPMRLNREAASISFFNMSFQAGSWKRNIQYAQLFGTRKAEDWSIAQAVARAKDEVLAAIVEIQRAENGGVTLDQYIASHKERTVLVLGDYSTEGLARLNAITTELDFSRLQTDTHKRRSRQSVPRHVAESCGHWCHCEVCGGGRLIPFWTPCGNPSVQTKQLGHNHYAA